MNDEPKVHVLINYTIEQKGELQCDTDPATITHAVQINWWDKEGVTEALAMDLCPKCSFSLFALREDV